MFKKARDYTLFLEDILNAIEKIERYTKNFTFGKLCENDMAIDAIVRNLEMNYPAASHGVSKAR